MLALRRSPTPSHRAALAGSLALASLAFAAGCGDNLSALPEGSDGSRLGDAPLACLPNLDGRIDASELAPVLGVAASYRVSPPGETRAVDVVGTVDAQGVRRWRFDAVAPSDRTVALTASPLEGRWFASSFPHASFVAPLDAEATLLGVYSHDADALWLHGLASSEEKPKAGKTLLVYDAPLAVYRFPLAVGTAYTSKGHVSGGTLRGLPYVGTDTYAVEDDATGALLLQDVVFTEAHRVRLTVTVAPSAGVTVVTRQTSFLFECFGEVARAVAATGEKNQDFTKATELRRYAP
jgi:hypothetical protein